MDAMGSTNQIRTGGSGAVDEFMTEVIRQIITANVRYITCSFRCLDAKCHQDVVQSILVWFHCSIVLSWHQYGMWFLNTMVDQP